MVKIKPKELRIIILMLLAMITWGLSWTNAKIVGNYGSAPLMMFWRFFIATLSFAPIVWWHGHSLRITKDAIRSDLTEFKVGDGVRVHIKIQEAGKERVQVFAGIVIARKGTGVHETFTVRRISFGEGVEKVFPVHSPIIEKIEVDRESITRRARLYYIRDRVGKEATKVKERRLSEGKR